jgi:tRNA-2-methylthio-N6-dimethylallyladenosine synthase
MPDQIPLEEQQRRLAHLIDVVRGIAMERHERFIGRTLPILVEGDDRKVRQRMRGRTPHNVKVNFEGDARIGEIVDVDIVHATSESMLGRQTATIVAS